MLIYRLASEYMFWWHALIALFIFLFILYYFNGKNRFVRTIKYISRINRLEKGDKGLCLIIDGSLFINNEPQYMLYLRHKYYEYHSNLPYNIYWFFSSQDRLDFMERVSKDVENDLNKEYTKFKAQFLRASKETNH